MANYLENTWAKISGLFDAFPSQRNLEQDYYDPAKKSLMGFADNVGDYMSSALGGEPVRVIDKSRPATNEYVVPNQEPLDVQLRQGYAESIVPQDRGKIDITDIQAQEQTNDVISNMGYMTPQQMQAEVKERQPQDDLNAQMSGAEATQSMMEQNYDMNQTSKDVPSDAVSLLSMADAGSVPKGVSDFVSQQGGTTQDAVSLLSMADAGAITQDNANDIVVQVSANATPDQMNASLEDALERADTDRQIMEADFDFNKDMEGVNIAEKVEAGEVEPSFWDKTKKFLSDEETMLTLAQSFNTMRLEPDDALGKSIDKRLETIRKSKSTSSTVSLVRSKAMAEKDPVKKQKLLNAALMMEKDPSKSSTYFSQISDLMAGGVDKESWDRGWKIQQAFVKEEGVKSFGKQSASFRRVLESAVEPSAAGDLALVFNFMKILDPGSVVRESEFKNAASARAELIRNKDTMDVENFATIEGALLRLEKGTLLLPEQRDDFVETAAGLFKGNSAEYLDRRDFYYKQANNSGLNGKEIVGDPYGGNLKYADPKITYDMLPAEDKAKTNKAEFEKYFNSLGFMDKVRKMKQLGL